MTVAEIAVSIVVPVLDEIGNIAPLVAEIEAAMGGSMAFECLYVDDGSTDGTGGEIERVLAGRPWLRHIAHATPCGKSAAVRTAVLAARSPVIVTMDGDGQNDPAAIPALVAALREAGAGCGLVAGQRIGRKDTAFKRWQSIAANRIRAAWLRDGTLDTNCGLKCFPREVYLALPFFDGLHRFLPALVRRDGYSVALVDVTDRPRLTGTSKYGLFDRLWVGIADLVGVHWLIRRRPPLPRIVERSPR